MFHFGFHGSGSADQSIVQPPDDIQVDGSQDGDSPDKEQNGGKQVGYPLLPAFPPPEKPNRMHRPEHSQ